MGLEGGGILFALCRFCNVEIVVYYVDLLFVKERSEEGRGRESKIKRDGGFLEFRTVFEYDFLVVDILSVLSFGEVDVFF